MGLAVSMVSLADTNTPETTVQSPKDLASSVSSQTDRKSLDSAPEGDRKLAMNRVAVEEDELEQGQNYDSSEDGYGQASSSESSEEVEGSNDSNGDYSGDSDNYYADSQEEGEHEYANEDYQGEHEYADEDYQGEHEYAEEDYQGEHEYADEDHQGEHEYADEDYQGEHEYADEDYQGEDADYKYNDAESGSDFSHCMSFSCVDNSEALEERIKLFDDKLKEAQDLGQTTVEFTAGESEALLDLDYFLEELECRINNYKSTLVHGSDSNSFSEEYEDEGDYGHDEDIYEGGEEGHEGEEEEHNDEEHTYYNDEEYEEEPESDENYQNPDDYYEEKVEEEDHNGGDSDSSDSNQSSDSDDRKKRVRIIRHLRHPRPHVLSRPHFKRFVIRRRAAIHPHPFAHNIRSKLLNINGRLMRRIPIIRKKFVVRRQLGSGLKPKKVIRRLVKHVIPAASLVHPQNLI